MFVWRKWTVTRYGSGLFSKSSSGYHQKHVISFEGLFLLGIIPLYIKQVTRYQ